MKESEIANALKGLPRASASPHFTSKVLVAVRTSGRRTFTWRTAAALAATLCLVVVFAHAAFTVAQEQKLRVLRAEHRQIQSELEQVKAIADEAAPVIVLENDDTRVVVDVADRRPNPQPMY